MLFVPVVSKSGKPLMPCHPARARELVRNGKAVRRFSVKRGTYHVIRTDGTEIVREEKPTIAKINRELGCDTLSSVSLTRRNAHQPSLVMMVHDTGMFDGLPVNEKASALQREAKGQAYPYEIHGPVVVVDDEDFRVTRFMSVAVYVNSAVYFGTLPVLNWEEVGPFITQNGFLTSNEDGMLWFPASVIEKIVSPSAVMLEAL